MGLRQTAETDLGKIIADDVHGFGWSVTVIDPAGLSKDTKGFTNDISQLIDPDTGQAVSGRLASVGLHISTLNTLGFTSLPINISDSSSKPWLIKFNDINGNAFTFKVQKGDPDRTLGLVMCIVELYKE